MNEKIKKISFSALRLSPLLFNYSINGLEKVVDPKENLRHFLEPLSRVNIFVGANNSGKSRLMREMSALREHDLKLTSVDLLRLGNNLAAVISVLRQKHDQFQIQMGHLSPEHFISSNMTVNPSVRWSETSYEGLKEQVKDLLLDANLENLLRNVKNPLGAAYPEFKQSIFKQLEEIHKDLQKVPDLTIAEPLKIVYIPTLRGLRNLDDAKTDYYQQVTRQEYFSESQDRPEIFTGLGFYQGVTELLLGSNSERRQIQNYQSFLSSTFFGNAPVTLIPSTKQKRMVIRIGDEADREIHRLGDGIQSMIILTFLAFTRQDEQVLFYIEEPEMFLHPGLQRKLLEFFASEVCQNHTFFLTTHSNHFLDLTIDFKDVSIFTFRKVLEDSGQEDKEARFTVDAVDRDCQSSLELLGVKNSSVFLVNATIWVEGITDRWYFRELLSSYMHHLKEKGVLDFQIEEDVHFSFVEYSGSNIIHWSFLEKEDHPIVVDRLCAKALVIIDKDGNSKLERKNELERKLGDRLIILDCKEVENLLPPIVIESVVKEYERNSDLKLKSFTYEDYQDQPIGKFIESKVLPAQYKGRKYAGEYNTLTDKNGFCKKALPHLRYGDLHPNNQITIETIYNFVVEQNSEPN